LNCLVSVTSSRHNTVFSNISKKLTLKAIVCFINSPPFHFLWNYTSAFQFLVINRTLLDLVGDDNLTFLTHHFCTRPLFGFAQPRNIKRTSIPWVGNIDHPNCTFTIARSKVLTSNIYYILQHCNYTRSTSINCFLFGFASHNPSSIHPSLPSPAYLPPTNTFMLNPLQSFPTHPSIIEAF